MKTFYQHANKRLVHLRLHIRVALSISLKNIRYKMASTYAISAIAESISEPPRKKFKTSELPLNSSQRGVIDGLLHTLKKKGEFDSVRKQVWSRFEAGVSSFGPCSTPLYLHLDHRMEERNSIVL